MSSILKERRPFRIKRKIAKLFSKLSSKLSSAFKFTGRIFRSEASLFVSDPELTDSKSRPVDPMSLNAKLKQACIIPGSDSTMVYTSTDESSSVEILKQTSLNGSYNSQLIGIASNNFSSDPCIPILRGSFDNSRYSSREASRFRLSSIDEISPTTLIDCMNLQFNVMPLAVQPEKVERDNKAKRSKSAQSRKSLKSAPSLANMAEWSHENSEMSLFDELSGSKHSSSFKSKSFGPQELRSLMNSLRIEEKLQSSANTKSKKNKKLSWGDELFTDRCRSLSDAHAHFKSKKSQEKNSYISSYTTQSIEFKETSSIFVQDREAIFVNRLGEKECSTTQINQYHIIREIGNGAFGTVYLCKSALNGQYFALKMISKSRLKKKMRWKAMMNGPGQLDISEEMRREIAVLKKLSRHPNLNYLVEVLDSSADDNIYLSRIMLF
jgi:hypothetical protein